MLAITKITAEGQTTNAQDVCTALKVAPGDLVACEFGTDASATMRRIAPLDLAYLRAVEGTLSEWLGAADEQAYRNIRVPRQPGSVRGQIMICDDFDALLDDFDEYQ